MVGTWPPPPPLIPALSVSASSQVTTMDPPALYHDVDWTWGMKLDRKASPCWTVPWCSSLTRLGVYHTKLGAPALLRSAVSDVALATAMGAFGKYSHGKW